LLIAAPLTTVVSIACAWLFHIAVERRFLNPPMKLAEPDGKGGRRVAIQDSQPVLNPE
jgi:hypothetical protein